MKIALDYDGTVTADLALWLVFISHCIARRHEVWIVTMRFESECMPPHSFSEDILKMCEISGGGLICTRRKAKKPMCELLGHKFDIWIDDHPEALVMDAEQAWPNTEARPEGKPHDPVHDAPLKARTA